MAIGVLRGLELPPPARKACDGLENVVASVREVLPALAITVDPSEFRGFEYHAGLSFAFFAPSTRGELGRGGRYLLDDGEPATGFTMYLDSLLRGLSPAVPEDRIYLPVGAERDTAGQLREEGWRTVQGLAEAEDILGEARRLRCTHALLDGKIVAVGGN